MFFNAKPRAFARMRRRTRLAFWKRFPRNRRNKTKAAPAAIVETPKQTEDQLDLFGITHTIEIYPAPTRFKSVGGRKVKKARDHKKKGLQYKFRLRVRTTDRVVEYKSRDNQDHREVNTETVNWSNDSIIKLHKALLFESLGIIKRCDELEYATHAEIWKWIESSNADEPFSYIRCCELSGVDPDIIKSGLKRLVNGDLPHIELLRRSVLAAESGDPDAIQWCMSDSKAPLSFADCCRAVGIKAKEAFKELRIPVNTAAMTIAA